MPGCSRSKRPGVAGPAKHLLSGHFSNRGLPEGSSGTIDQHKHGFQVGVTHPQLLGASAG